MHENRETSPSPDLISKSGRSVKAEAGAAIDQRDLTRTILGSLGNDIMWNERKGRQPAHWFHGIVC
jgi:hypothetical protein